MKFRSLSNLITTCLLVFAGATLAHAQTTRTWVSANGSDADPCSRSLPCKTFAGALVNTAVNGEINVLDPGGYGSVTVTKSVTIDGAGPHSSMLASAATGVTIIFTTSAAQDPLTTVRLRNLSINGTGACAPAPCAGSRSGTRGVNVSSGNNRAVKLFVENVVIHGFINEGIFFNGPGGDLTVRNSSIVDNGGTGIRVLSNQAGTTGTVHVTIDKTHTNLNQQGVRFEGNVTGTIKDSAASNNTLNGYVANSTAFGNSEMNIVDSTANDNRQFGVFSGGTGFTSTVRIMNVTAINNTSLQLEVAAGGSICTNAKNHVGTPTDLPSCNFNDL